MLPRQGVNNHFNVTMFSNSLRKSQLKTSTAFLVRILPLRFIALSLLGESINNKQLMFESSTTAGDT